MEGRDDNGSVDKTEWGRGGARQSHNTADNEGKIRESASEEEEKSVEATDGAGGGVREGGRERRCDTYLASSTTSTSAWAVMGALE